jgi:hypothetical protein
MSAASPNAVVAEKVPQQEEAKPTPPPNFKATPMPALMGAEHPMTSSESASLHQLQQEHAAEVRSQDAAIHPMPNSAPGTSIKQASVSQPAPARMEAYSAPQASGASGGFAPRAETSANINSMDRSAFNSNSASANTYAVTPPSTFPSSLVMRDSVVVNGKKLALDQDGRLYSSVNQGATWREIHKQWSGTATMLMLAPWNSAPVANKGAAANGSAIMLSNSSNAFWISTDGGETWKPYSKKN